MASQNVVTVTAQNFDEEVLKSNVPVLLDFWAPWCGPCRQIGPVVEEIADEKAGQAKVAKINIDEAGNDQVAAQFGINAIPALLFFKGGAVADQVIGRAPKSTLVTKLEALI